jgi:hypothetical protein
MLELNEVNINDVSMSNDGEEGWYRFDESKIDIVSKLNVDGYYKIKCIDDSIIESIEYIGLELNIDKFDNVFDSEIGLLGDYEYINYKS